MTATLDTRPGTTGATQVPAVNPGAPGSSSPTPKGSIARNIGSMLLGRVFVAALGWAGSIAIARSLGSEEWGQYSFVFGLLGLLSVITDLGVGRVVLSRLVGDSESETRLVASSFIALRLGLGLIGYAAAVGFVVLADYPGVVVTATAIAGLVVVIATPSHSLTVLYQSRLKLTVVSVIESLSQIVQLAATVIAVIVAPVLLVVVIPAVLFELVSLISKGVVLHRGGLGFRPAKRIEIWRWSEMLREAFPLSIGFALTVLLTKIDIPLLSKLDSFDAVGHYAIAYKFSDLVSMIGIAVTTPLVTVLVASWPERLEEFRGRMRDAAVLTTLLGGMAVIGIWPSAAPLIRLLYGPDYADAALATRLLVLGAGLSSFTLLGVMTLVSTGRLRTFPIIAAFGLALNVIANVVLIPRMSFEGSAVATVGTEIVVCVLIWATVLREVAIGDLFPWRTMLGLVGLIAVLTAAVALLAPADSVVGIVLGAVGALALPVAARVVGITDSIDPRRMLSGPAPTDSGPNPSGSGPHGDGPDTVGPDLVDTATVVEPTFFGPAVTPLFGTVHRPVSGVARAGVVMCPPLGKEQIDTTRGVRMLAEDLALSGMVVLRMDHLHTGESWGEQDSPDAVENWLAGIVHAVDHVRGTGVGEVVVVGLRAGGLLATAAAERIDGLAGLVLWDPVLRGRTFVRGQTQLFRMAVAADSAGSSLRGHTDDVVDIVGAGWHRTTAQALSAMSITLDSLPDCPVLLATSDADLASAPARALLHDERPAGRVEVVRTVDPTAFVTPPSFLVELPHESVHAIGAWIDQLLPTEPLVVHHRTRSWAVVDGEPAGSASAEVITEIVTAPDRPLVWITRPAQGIAHSALVVHSTAADIRTGPARLWRDLAVEAGRLGAVTVRYDRRGVGESGRVRRADDFAPLHSPTSITDAREVRDLARSLTPGPLTHVGICSGSWSASRVALDVADDAPGQLDRVVLVNQLTWRRDAPVLGGDAPFGPEVSGAVDDAAPSLRGRLKPIVARFAPYVVFDAVARLGVMQSPRLLLRPLAKAGIETHLVFGSRDYEHFLSQRGLQALSSVSRGGRGPSVHVAPGGDHPGFHPVVREAVLTECLHAVALDGREQS
ncbi:oligosaccharide flippase family protein [Williamsia herbipolensis]|uniref:Oligosaccharide flippase family protein n=1 Tax=Williamsia herbipolensis TaxID=1603258 RepID=A0AAU4K7T9_9NOCA|nr:oligosaccharide flippase family protein [Williamsia herbipolensis]